MFANPDFIPIETLKASITSYEATKSHAIDTNSGVLSLKELEAFITKIKLQDPEIDGVRIYLVRDFPNPTLPTPWAENFLPIIVNGKETTQMTFAIVPVTNFATSHQGPSATANSPTDFVSNGKIFALIPGEFNTALCPPRC
jgi:hypothetical protein